MTRRITKDELFAFAAGHFPEPFAPVSGHPHGAALIAALVNHVTAADEAWNAANSTGRRSDIHIFREGIMVALGEVLSDRSWSRREDADYTDQEWLDLCVFRAHGYLTWVKELLEKID